MLLPPGYWIAGLDLGDEHVAHALVMRGRDVVWDPQPKPHRWEHLTVDPLLNGFAFFVALDPAKLASRD